VIQLAMLSITDLAHTQQHTNTPTHSHELISSVLDYSKHLHSQHGAVRSCLSCGARENFWLIIVFTVCLAVFIVAVVLVAFFVVIVAPTLRDLLHFCCLF